MSPNHDTTARTRPDAADGTLTLKRVLGDLGAWLEETERHRVDVKTRPKTI